LLPVGALIANWSNVNTVPPAAIIRARAVDVNRKAAIVNDGISIRRSSSVTVPTITIILFSYWSSAYLIIRVNDIGGLLIRDWYNLFNITALNWLLVRRDKKRYNLTNKRK